MATDRFLLTSFVLLFFVLAPSFAMAEGGLVPCGTASNAKAEITNPCTFNHLITLAQNIINFLIGLGVVVAALGFAYAGFLYITAMGSEEKIKHAHALFIKVVLGFVVMLSAWLVVRVLEDTFLTDAQKSSSFLLRTTTAPASMQSQDGTDSDTGDGTN